MSGDRPETPPIYVGYLPIPVRHQRLLRAVAPLLVVVALVLGAVTASMQRDPGPAEWHGERGAYTGTLAVAPYPVLIPDEPGALPMLLVAEGKFGAVIAPDLYGARVEVRGRLLERDEARMIELAAGRDAIHDIGGSGRSPESPPETASVVLRGEIVDSKCCLGAMKPGEGKTHRACATLCIRGGIPPILVSADEHGAAVYTLLTDAVGGPANALVLPYVAEQVEVRGTLSVERGLRTLKIEAVTRANDEAPTILQGSS